jgi:TLD
MTSTAQISKLCDRYPFSVEEMEILVRCHYAIQDEKDDDSFLTKMARSLPYSYFFLPGEEMKKRIQYIEDHVLPMGFSNELRAAISADAFVNYANEEQDLNLERFIEGVADTGRRGPKEALRVLYDILPDAMAASIIDLCYRLALAAEILVEPAMDEKAIQEKLHVAEQATKPLVNSLREASHGAEVTKQEFIAWADQTAPMMASILSTFIHSLIFHGRPFPVSRIPYSPAILDAFSDIFQGRDSPLLFPLSAMSRNAGGKMHRLYSSVMDGFSFNRLEWNLIGYGGPTLVLIQTECDVVLGAFASQSWKDTYHFYGTSENFVFQLEPVLRVFHATGKDDHFMYCHGSSRFGGSFGLTEASPLGLGFGGSICKPRLFLPESLEECSADFFDVTYESGDLLPKEAMESFRIKYLEVWGVGGGKVIEGAMAARSEYRERMNASIENARTVLDPRVFVAGLQSGLLPSKAFIHSEQARGRADFCIDEVHGGYKLEMDST